ncbi:hypothetical protein KP509_23G060300 [Ceratopteris richardii]|uniref:DYW domain-containing protein n=1 Tax=Ceratopteris richardii TaxID=49495 RepID=A0A8T2S102_CERRI|nr:hypothetical protein KP509_23G060300 [Ceratopteris richardii]
MCPVKSSAHRPFLGSYTIPPQSTNLTEKTLLPTSFREAYGQYKYLIEEEVSDLPSKFQNIVEQYLLCKDLETHAEAYCIVCGIGLDLYNYIGSQLITILSEYGNVLEATRLFYRLHDPDAFAWGAFISGYTSNGQENLAINLYYQMIQTNVEPNSHIFRVVLKACANALALLDGWEIHSHIIFSDRDSNIFVCSALLDMYMKCHRLEDARGVFEDMPEHDSVTWSTLLAGYASQDLGHEVLDLFCQMKKGGISPTPVTFISVLKACSSISSLEEGQITHSSLIEHGYEDNIYLGNSLIDMYSKCGLFEHAQIVFNRLHVRDVGSWNAMIGSCALHGRLDEGIYLFEKMQDEGVKPMIITYVNVLKAIADGAALDVGRTVHSSAIMDGIESDVFVGSMLVHVYVHCGSLEEAYAIFNNIPSPNAVTWGTIICGYAEHGLGTEALLLSKKMQENGVEIDQGLLVAVLKASESSSCLTQGQSFHALAVEWDMQHDELVGNALISMYATCGNLDDAINLFNKRPHRSTMAWNALISGLASQSPDYVHGREALTAFWQMIQVVQPNEITYMSILKVCSNLCALNQGNMIHAHLIEGGLRWELKVGNALIAMYLKCGNLEYASCVANTLPSWDIVTFNTVIEGFGRSGLVKQALHLFDEMLRNNIEPNDSTFISILSACSHDGLVEKGHEFFELMKLHGIGPKIDHYDLMVDLIGRAGYLNEAEDFLETMPLTTDFVGWMAMLTHCNRLVNVDIGRRSFSVLVKMDPSNASSYVLMSNLYADAGMLEDAEKLDNIRKSTNGAIKKPGKAFIEIGNKVHEFSVGCRGQDLSGPVYAKLQELRSQLKQNGYKPHINMAQGRSSKEEESMLWEHCEKIAIAFGLINTAEGSTLRVSKNLRVCSDCHDATKAISKVEKREIFIVDTYRVHHFVGGQCSCQDCY